MFAGYIGPGLIGEAWQLRSLVEVSSGQMFYADNDVVIDFIRSNA